MRPTPHRPVANRHSPGASTHRFPRTSRSHRTDRSQRAALPRTENNETMPYAVGKSGAA